MRNQNVAWISNYSTSITGLKSSFVAVKPSGLRGRDWSFTSEKNHQFCRWLEVKTVIHCKINQADEMVIGRRNLCKLKKLLLCSRNDQDLPYPNNRVVFLKVSRRKRSVHVRKAADGFLSAWTAASQGCLSQMSWREFVQTQTFKWVFPPLVASGHLVLLCSCCQTVLQHWVCTSLQSAFSFSPPGRARREQPGRWPVQRRWLQGPR